MATLYTAKFNINEKIYQVSNGKVSLNTLLEKIYNGLNQDDRVLDERDENIEYKFVDLHRNDNGMIINGTIVKIYDGINSRYNEEEDNVIDEETSNKADYVSFSFDVRKEVVGFVPKLGFSKESFIRYFKKLVEECVPEIGEIVLILISDAAELDLKFKRMKTLKELEVIVIPANDDSKEIADLLDIVKDDIQESNAQHLGLNLKGTIREPLKKSSKLVKELKSAAKKAYASIIAIGRDESDSDYIINSEKDTLLRKTLRDDNKNSLNTIEELTQDSANIYITQKANEVINSERRKE